MLSSTGMMTSTSDAGQTSQMAKASVIWVIQYQDRKSTAQCKFKAYIWAFDQLYKKRENGLHPFSLSRDTYLTQPTTPRETNGSLLSLELGTLTHNSGEDV